MSIIGILDYHSGNLQSVVNTCEMLGARYQIVDQKNDMEKIDKLIVPGQGAANQIMSHLRATGLDDALRDWISRDRPYLGICIGAQILFERSEEGDTECLNLWRGNVKKITAEARLPHIGWNTIQMCHISPSPLEGEGRVRSEGVSTYFYFAHSYVCDPIDKTIIVATTTHGQTFPSILKKDNIWATQFHPEKSGELGLTFLKQFFDH